MIDMLEEIEKDILHIASGTFNFRKLQDLKCLFRNCSPEIIARYNFLGISMSRMRSTKTLKL